MSMNTYATRRKELNDFLDSIGAVKIQEYSSPTGTCQFYADENGIGFIIQITRHHKSSDDFSWEAFVPATSNNSVEVTFERVKTVLTEIKDHKL